MTLRQRRSATTIATVAVVAALVGLITAASHQVSKPRISVNEQNAAMRVITRVLPADRYDNRPANDWIVVRNKDLLGGDQPRRVFRAFNQGVPVAVAIETVAPIGYSGPIRLLVGVRADGRVVDVVVTAHRETAGLGDRIERAHSAWIDSFGGRSLSTTPAAEWAVRADGGQFDQFTGATVTPRAVVQAVRDALLYFDQHKDELFAPAP